MKKKIKSAPCYVLQRSEVFMQSYQYLSKFLVCHVTRANPLYTKS